MYTQLSQSNYMQCETKPNQTAKKYDVCAMENTLDYTQSGSFVRAKRIELHASSSARHYYALGF